MQDGQDMKFSIQDLAKLPARTADDGHQLEAQVSTRLCTTCRREIMNNTHPHPHVLQTDHWDGVRNYGARNVMKEMRVGDTAFFYHSNCKTPGIAGTVTIVREAYPDFTALDKKDPHYDPKVSSLTKKRNLLSDFSVDLLMSTASQSTKDEPRWYMVDVKLKEIFPKEISLKELQKHQDGKLKGWGGALLRRSFLDLTLSTVFSLTPPFPSVPSQAWSCSPRSA